MRPDAVQTIPAGLPFLDTLAAGIVDRLGDRTADPLAATRVTVLLPTRRACRALREAFLRIEGGKAALLPRILPLGDLEEDESAGAGLADGALRPTLDFAPPIAPLERQVLLARLILARDSAKATAGGDSAMTPAQALRLAQDLAGLLDLAQTEHIDLSTVAALVPQTSPLAEHWQLTLDFLALLTSVWPGLLAAHHALDPADHRNKVLDAQAAAWAAHPPAGPVIAAGSTGSVPATAALLATIAHLPQGLVVLPGLDIGLDDESWEALEDSHPQAGMKRLLDTLGLSRQAVRFFSETPPRGAIAAPPARALLVREALRPAATTDRWRRLRESGPSGGEAFARALDGVTLVRAAGPREEAAAIAVMMRGALETPGRTAALITPDRALARRVAAALGRWGLRVDDSAGRPLSQTPVGAFLRLAAQAVADGLGPVALLSLLQHPLAAGGEDPVVFRARLRLLDREVLRGPRPDPGVAGLAQAIKAADDPDMERHLGGWLERLEALAGPFCTLMDSDEPVDVAALIDAHMRFCEGLAEAREGGVEKPGATRLWAGDDGEAAALLGADLTEAAPSLGAIAPRHYPALLDALMDGRAVRPKRDLHSRLFLWGPLEARLQRADLLILGGLNEGGWPAAVDTGPWMSRPMLDQIGLPQPERRIGLAAHDVSQALCAPEVAITRALRVEGTPTVPSRWLTRLDAVIGATGLDKEWAKARQRGDRLLALARSLEQPQGERKPCPAPEPRPPLADRPRRLSVTRIETWMRDPYALYAQFILGLSELDPLEADPGVSDYGTLVHGALEDFVGLYPKDLPGDPEAEIIRLGTLRFAPHMTRPGVRAFWWPRFLRIAHWIAEREIERRPEILEVFAERRAEMTLTGPAGPFILTAKADRIDLRRDGTLAVIDYKTGMLPSKKEVESGLSPQLPLEALLASRGCFPGIAGKPVSDLGFWKLRGDRLGGEIRQAADDPEGVAEAAHKGLSDLITAFDNPDTPY
ncbi:double-strand break repair protein AddB, partial [Rhodospirillum rubrum]